jgi:hypothetical protein
MVLFRLDFSRLLSAAGVSALLLWSAPAISAQPSAFIGLGGAWSGGGTISLSDGSTERIRCRANYRVGGGGTTLKQSLRCASDSYRFDLNSDVVSQGESISGTWSESSRNINGSLLGRASGEFIAVFVEAAGFAAYLTLTTHGSRQSVSIISQGEIKSVSLALVRG